ncbi:MAG TPA: RraA family protein [Candidatus Dormibacteraeota bacterium]
MDETWLSSSLAADASRGEGVLPEWIRPLQPGARVIGAATTCSVGPGDNLGVRQALLAGPRTGPVLVVGGAAESSSAIMGGLVAEALSMNGFIAVVTDGLIRDSVEVAEMVKVWCRGLTPKAPAKDGPSSVGEVVSVGGVRVAPGDLVICDADGVVIWPAAATATLRERARQRDAQDTARGAALRRTGRLD